MYHEISLVSTNFYSFVIFHMPTSSKFILSDVREFTPKAEYAQIIEKRN